MSFQQEQKKYQEKQGLLDREIAHYQSELVRLNNILINGKYMGRPYSEYAAMQKAISDTQRDLEITMRQRDRHIKTDPQYPQEIQRQVQDFRRKVKAEQKYDIPPSSQFVGSPYGNHVIDQAPDDTYGPMDLGFAFRRKSKRKSPARKRKSPARKRKSPALKRKSKTSRRRSRARK